MNKHADIPSPSTGAARGKATDDAPAPARRSRRVLQALLALAMLAAGFGGWKVIMALAPQPKVRPAVEHPEPVRVITAKAADVRPAWTFYGEVVPARVSTLQLPVSGRITWVSPKWKDGARVQAGEELLRIDEVPYRAAVAEAEAALKEAQARLEEARLAVSSAERLLKEAQAQFAVAQREYDRTRTLVARGSLPKARLDAQQQKYLTAREKLEQRKQALSTAKARLAQVKAALTRSEWQLKKAKDNLANATLRAPFSGQLSQVKAEVGQSTGPGAALATLLSDGAPEIRFTIPETRLHALKRSGEQVAGREVAILVPTRAGDVTLSGRVVRESASVVRKQGAAALFARPDAPDRARWLKPGAFVQVRMNGPLYRNVVLLPESALQGDDTVYAVKDGRLARLPVRVLGMVQGRVIVRGVAPGTAVVRHKLAEPKPGKPVKVLDQG